MEYLFLFRILERHFLNAPNSGMSFILQAPNSGTPLILECPYFWKAHNSGSSLDLILERPYGVFTPIFKDSGTPFHHLFWNAPNLECPFVIQRGIPKFGMPLSIFWNAPLENTFENS